jgi:hypothetical protein
VFLSLERDGSNTSSERCRATDGSMNSGQLIIPDESTLSRFVAARLDLHISQRLLGQNYKLSIIKRCFEDQLRLKRKYNSLYLIVLKTISMLDNDFADDCDLLMAAMILQKQIECINGKKENIIVPSVAINKIREKERAGNT